MNKDTASDIVEVFSSIQGEGLLVGFRQIFLRFYGCNLACDYCDTSAAKETDPPEFCIIEKTPGRRDFVYLTNPVTLEQLTSVIDRWQKEYPGVHHSISLTGGEPLLQVETLKKWLPQLRKSLPLYLETNGVLHEALAEVINFIDFISMDIKIPSTSGVPQLWREHESFMQIAAQKQLYVKIVISEETEVQEIVNACELISSINSGIPLILQPQTMPLGKVGINPLRSFQFQEVAAGFLKETRIIPQTHVFAGYL